MTPESPSPFAEPTGDISGIDADALMAQVEAGEPATPQPAATPAPAAAPQAQAPAVPEVEFTWNGKPIKAPLDRVKQWAQQGYDYNQRMAEFNKRQQELETNKKTLDEQLGLYRQIDDYAKQNPDWWTSVQQAYETRANATQAADPNNPLNHELQSLKTQLQDVSKFITQTKAEKEAATRADQDRALAEEVKSLQAEYPDLDFRTPTEDGKSLEYKVLEYAAQNGIKNFRTAFRDFNHERLMKLYEERGKELAVKESQKNKKLGLLGQTPAPKKGITPLEDIKSKSYDDIYHEIVEEIGA